jgi:hypothetical protein
MLTAELRVTLERTLHGDAAALFGSSASQAARLTHDFSSRSE